MINAIKDCLSQFLKNPTTSSAEALVVACGEEENTSSWGGFESFSSQKITPDEILSSVCIEAFYNDRTDILDVFNPTLKFPPDFTPDFTANFTPFSPPKPALISYESIVRKLIPHIAAAILSHKHTETMVHILAPTSTLSEYLNDELFSAAVYSENYPVVRCMQEAHPFNIDITMMQLLMEKEKYELLDLLLDNGKFIKQSCLIHNIIYEAAATGEADILKWINFLAERYSPLFDGSNEAEGDFIVKNSEIDIVVSNIYDNISNIYSEGAEIVLNYLVSRGVTLFDAGLAITSCATSMTDQNDALIIKTITRLIGDESFICYEDIMVFNIRICDVRLHNNLKMLITKISENLMQPIKMDICNKPSHYFTSQNISILKTLLKYCRVNPVLELSSESVIETAILCNKHVIINALLNSDSLSAHVIEDMIDMCTKHQSYKCLNEITKYCQKQRGV